MDDVECTTGDRVCIPSDRLSKPYGAIVRFIVEFEIGIVMHADRGAQRRRFSHPRVDHLFPDATGCFVARGVGECHAIVPVGLHQMMHPAELRGEGREAWIRCLQRASAHLIIEVLGVVDQSLTEEISRWHGAFQFSIEKVFGMFLLILLDIVHGHLRCCSSEFSGIKFVLIQFQYLSFARAQCLHIDRFAQFHFAVLFFLAVHASGSNTCCCFVCPLAVLVQIGILVSKKDASHR